MVCVIHAQQLPKLAELEIRLASFFTLRLTCHHHFSFALQLPELAEMEVGLANFFVQHTSASLTINENASPGARRQRGAAHALR